MIIKYYLLFFGSFARNLENKLSTHDSNPNFRLVRLSGVEFFFLEGVLIQNFNIVDFVNFFEKIQKLHIQIIAVTLKMTSYKTMSKKTSEKKVKRPRFYGQNKLLS
jgi:hypothetical protein